MIQSIRHGLTHIFDFSGRDARQTFWFYVLFLVVAQFIIGMVAAIPLYVSVFTQALESASAGGESAEAMEAFMSNMIGQMRLQMIISTVLGVIMTVMLTASFVRRLHDGGFSGWIAAVPVCTQIFSLVYTYTFFDRIEEVMRETMATTQNAAQNGDFDPFAAQAEMGVMGLVGWIGLLIIIGFGIVKSEDGPNTYGDAPTRF
ncbi:MAG: DUF805 domain-containing protein [Erythrobacter sp.]